MAYHWGGALLLNPLLHRELHDACRGALALQCFADLSEGLTAFAKSVGETKLPSENETCSAGNRSDRFVTAYSFVTAYILTCVD